MTRLVLGLAVAGLLAAQVTSAFADDRVSASKKGSLLVYNAVEVKWNAAGDITQDTFLSLINDYPGTVDVQLYLVNGDDPLDAVYVGDPAVLVERAHEGCNWVDNVIHLTQDQPIYWSAAMGGPTSPWTVLDPGPMDKPGRPDLEDPTGLNRVLRGFVVAWAVDANGEEISWDHLAGSALVVDYAHGAASEYNAWAFQAGGDLGVAPDGVPGQLLLDGIEYDIAFSKLLLDFYAGPGVGLENEALSGGGRIVTLDTDLTLLPMDLDLRQDTLGPPRTKVKFDVWNMDEVKFSGLERCITCWDQVLFSNYDSPHHLQLFFLGTAKGKARLDGMASSVCPGSENVALLGISTKIMAFDGEDYAHSAINLVGMGEEAGSILFEPVDVPETAEIGKRSGR